MPVIRAQVNITYTTNIPEDVISNTLYFNADAEVSLSEAADALTPILQKFYRGIYVPNGLPFYVNRTNLPIKFYDMSEPEPRVPDIRTMDLSTAAQQSTSIPTEVATVLSFQADREAGIPQARRRGRIYIGALVTGCITAASGAGQFPRISATWRNAITASAEDLVTEAAAAFCPWVVFSRAATNVFEVTNGWIDNEPDTQRRRGVAPNSRSLWPA